MRVGFGNFVIAKGFPLGDKFNIKGIPDTHDIFPSESNQIGWWMQTWTSDRSDKSSSACRLQAGILCHTSSYNLTLVLLFLHQSQFDSKF